MPKRYWPFSGNFTIAALPFAFDVMPFGGSRLAWATTWILSPFGVVSAPGVVVVVLALAPPLSSPPPRLSARMIAIATTTPAPA